MNTELPIILRAPVMRQYCTYRSEILRSGRPAKIAKIRNLGNLFVSDHLGSPSKMLTIGFCLSSLGPLDFEKIEKNSRKGGLKSKEVEPPWLKRKLFDSSLIWSKKIWPIFYCFRVRAEIRFSGSPPTTIIGGEPNRPVLVLFSLLECCFDQVCPDLPYYTRLLRITLGRGTHAV